MPPRILFWNKKSQQGEGRKNDGFESGEGVAESEEKITENEIESKIKSKIETKTVNENDYDETADKGDNVKYMTN
jgi:hypothetical protein